MRSFVLSLALVLVGGCDPLGFWTDPAVGDDDDDDDDDGEEGEGEAGEGEGEDPPTFEAVDVIDPAREVTFASFALAPDRTIGAVALLRTDDPQNLVQELVVVRGDTTSSFATRWIARSPALVFAADGGAHAFGFRFDDVRGHIIERLDVDTGVFEEVTSFLSLDGSVTLTAGAAPGGLAVGLSTDFVGLVYRDEGEAWSEAHSENPAGVGGLVFANNADALVACFARVDSAPRIGRYDGAAFTVSPLDTEPTATSGIACAMDETGVVRAVYRTEGALVVTTVADGALTDREELVIGSPGSTGIVFAAVAADTAGAHVVWVDDVGGNDGDVVYRAPDGTTEIVGVTVPGNFFSPLFIAVDARGAVTIAWVAQPILGEPQRANVVVRE